MPSIVLSGFERSQIKAMQLARIESEKDQERLSQSQLTMHDQNFVYADAVATQQAAITNDLADKITELEKRENRLSANSDQVQTALSFIERIDALLERAKAEEDSDLRSELANQADELWKQVENILTLDAGYDAYFEFTRTTEDTETTVITTADGDATSLLDQTNTANLQSGRSWSTTALSYAFNDDATDYDTDTGTVGVQYHVDVDPTDDFGQFSATQQTNMNDIVGHIQELTGLTFTNMTGASDVNAGIRMALSDSVDTAAAFYPSSTEIGGDIWVHNGTPSWASSPPYESPVVGNYAYATFMHELAHALGLKHGHEAAYGVPALSADRDSVEYSVMTYRSYVGDPLIGGYSNETYGYPQTLMMYDIAALQAIYGANYSTNATDTNYVFDPTSGVMTTNGVAQDAPLDNRIFRTIWDGGGFDLYDFTAYSTDIVASLRPGGYIDLDSGGNAQRASLGDGNYARGHIFNALMADGDNPASGIESLYAGSGNDILVGNDLNNIIEGNGGDDRIFGGIGDDGIAGDAGNDVIFDSEASSDYVHGGDDTDLLVLNGNAADYAISNSVVGRGTVTHIANGTTDTYDYVEYLVFDDGYYDTSSLTGVVTPGASPIAVGAAPDGWPITTSVTPGSSVATTSTLQAKTSENGTSMPIEWTGAQNEWAEATDISTDQRSLEEVRTSLNAYLGIIETKTITTQAERTQMEAKMNLTIAGRERLMEVSEEKIATQAQMSQLRAQLAQSSVQLASQAQQNIMRLFAA